MAEGCRLLSMSIFGQGPRFETSSGYLMYARTASYPPSSCSNSLWQITQVHHVDAWGGDMRDPMALNTPWGYVLQNCGA